MSQLIQINDGDLTTNTWLIARECERRHGDVVKSFETLVCEGFIQSTSFSQIEISDDKGRKQKAYELTESVFLKAMPFICGRKGKKGQSALVDEFMRLRSLADLGHSFLQAEQKEQASVAGRGLANWRWGKPVFDLQLELPLAEVVSLGGRA